VYFVTIISLYLRLKISAIRTAYAAIVLVGIVYAFIVLRGENGIPGLMAKRAPVQDFEAGQPEAHPRD